MDGPSYGPMTRVYQYVVELGRDLERWNVAFRSLILHKGYDDGLLLPITLVEALHRLQLRIRGQWFDTKQDVQFVRDSTSLPEVA